MDDLAALGWDEGWAAAFAALGEPGLRPGRVTVDHGRFHDVATGAGEVRAVAAGRLRHQAATAAELPTVGDWVALRHAPGEALATIRHLLPRRGRFSRRDPGRATEQVVAANVDTVFLMMALDADFSPRRLERYLAVAHASGARPVVVLNKSDLCAEVATRRAEVEAVAAGAPVLALSLRDPAGHEPVLPFLAPARTVALLGSSGVGKSTLFNRLAGTDLQRTTEVRASDSKGRHTTTRAQLFALPGGALVIDTPGLRELQLWEDATHGLGDAFDDVEALAAACRFRDCAHSNEPGCAVRAAVETGELLASRYESWAKLRGELAALTDDPRVKFQRKQGDRAMARALRKRLQEKKE